MATRLKPSASFWIEAFVRERRLLVALTLLAGITVAGTTGFVVIEGMSLLDAVFMTVITLSTVGYREVSPLSDTGRVFTVGLITVGIGSAFYTVVELASFVIEGRMRTILGRSSMQRAIDRVDGHVIICGFGRLGKAVIEMLRGVQVVVIDTDESVQRECEEAGCLFVHGSALEDNVLRAAGIERARALIVATANDPDNVFIALSARELQPELQIHARAESAAGIRRLSLSGASQVISPHQLAGRRIANALMRPGVVEFLELSTPGVGAEVDLEEIVLAEASPVDGVPLGRLRDQDLHVSVIAIKRGDEPIRLHPPPDEVLRAGDRLIAVGDRSNLVRLAKVAGSS